MDKLKSVEGDINCYHNTVPYMPLMGTKCTKCDKIEIYDGVKDAYGTSYMARWVESEMLINAIGKALDGEEPSDFEMSFPIVRKAYDMYHSKETT